MRGHAWAIAPCSSYNDTGQGSPFLQGKAEFGATYPSIRKWTTQPKKHAVAGSVLVSVRAPVGPANLAPVDCSIGRGLAALMPREPIASEFVLWAMRASENRLAGQASGSTFDAITGAQLREHQLPVPPLPEQERIVTAIEEHFSRLDVVEAVIVGASRRLDALRGTILDRAFHDDTANMQEVEIADMAEVSGGIQKQPKRYPRENRYPFLRVANVGRGLLDLAEVHEIELFDGEIERFKLRSGDLLVVEGNGSVSQIGRAALWSGEIDECVHQNHLIRVRPSDELLPEYLALCWNAPRTAQQVRSVASSTSGLHTLSTSKVKSIRLPVASLPHQRRVVMRLDQQLRSVELARSGMKDAVRHVGQMRRTVLTRAFVGELVSPHAFGVPVSPGRELATAALQGGSGPSDSDMSGVMAPRAILET